MPKLIPGQPVRLRAYGDEVIERIVIDLLPGTVVVTTEEEYRAAQSERRPIVGVGFSVEDVVQEMSRE